MATFSLVVKLKTSLLSIIIILKGCQQSILAILEHLCEQVRQGEKKQSRFRVLL